MESCTNQWTGLYMMGISLMKELTKLNNKFYRIRREERIISHVHIILISHVYISMFMSVSNGWKSHSG